MIKARMVPTNLPDCWTGGNTCYHIQYKFHRFGFWRTLCRIVEGTDGGTVNIPIDFDLEGAKETIKEFSELKNSTFVVVPASRNEA